MPQSAAALKRAIAPSFPPADAAARRTPFLLTMPGYGGTLAAARCLGAHGVPVTMAGETLLGPAVWSRHVTRWLESPDALSTERFYSWLLEYGRREPGSVLYPTCDDLAWLFAARSAELGRYFRLYQPGVDTILRLLDKKALYHACQDAGIGVVPTAFPTSREGALRIGTDLRFPILMKPRTQIHLPVHGKGAIVETAAELAACYDRFVSEGTWPPRLDIPGIEVPMLQEYLPQASITGIYSMSGFIGRGDGQIAVRASQKVLQRPRRIGVGLCFEEAPVDGALLEKIVRMCRRVGYFGVFEAEFVRQGDEPLLIDFNPRFYGQMGFEVARGLPLAYLAWLGAMGDEAAIDRETAAARAWQEGRGYAYCDGFFLNLGLFAQGLAGRMPRDEVKRWRRWQQDRRSRAVMVNATGQADDRLPGVVAAFRELFWLARHPRTSLTTILGGRED